MLSIDLIDVITSKSNEGIPTGIRSNFNYHKCNSVLLISIMGKQITIEKVYLCTDFGKYVIPTVISEIVCS